MGFLQLESVRCVMDKYLKMADAFGDVVTQKLVGDAYEIVSDTYGHVCVVNTAGRADIVAHAINSHDELVAQRNELLSALEQCRDAFEYTRQYVGYETLPPINGWSWFDADQRAKDAIAKAKGESQ